MATSSELPGNAQDTDAIVSRVTVALSQTYFGIIGNLSAFPFSSQLYAHLNDLLETLRYRRLPESTEAAAGAYRDWAVGNIEVALPEQLL